MLVQDLLVQRLTQTTFLQLLVVKPAVVFFFLNVVHFELANLVDNKLLELRIILLLFPLSTCNFINFCVKLANKVRDYLVKVFRLNSLLFSYLLYFLGLVIKLVLLSYASLLNSVYLILEVLAHSFYEVFLGPN